MSETRKLKCGCGVEGIIHNEIKLWIREFSCEEHEAHHLPYARIIGEDGYTIGYIIPDKEFVQEEHKGWWQVVDKYDGEIYGIFLREGRAMSYCPRYCEVKPVREWHIPEKGGYQGLEAKLKEEREVSRKTYRECRGLKEENKQLKEALTEKINECYDLKVELQKREEARERLRMGTYSLSFTAVKPETTLSLKYIKKHICIKFWRAWFLDRTKFGGELPRNKMPIRELLDRLDGEKCITDERKTEAINWLLARGLIDGCELEGYTPTDKSL